MNIVVLGSGGWGTALAMLLEQNQHTVTLWSHDPQKAEQLKLKRENPLLPGVQLPVSCSGSLMELISNVVQGCFKILATA